MPGTWEQLYARSKRLMKRDPVRLDLDLREIVLDAVVDKLIEQGVEVIVASLTRDHLHVLARFTLHDPRMKIGVAKKHASHHVRQSGLRVDKGGLGGCDPAPNRSEIEDINSTRFLTSSITQTKVAQHISSKTESSDLHENHRKSPGIDIPGLKSI